jgi:hypothetical protein
MEGDPKATAYLDWLVSTVTPNRVPTCG